jgi:hypothetical protein
VSSLRPTDYAGRSTRGRRLPRPTSPRQLYTEPEAAPPPEWRCIPVFPILQFVAVDSLRRVRLSRLCSGSDGSRVHAPTELARSEPATGPRPLRRGIGSRAVRPDRTGPSRRSGSIDDGQAGQTVGVGADRSRPATIGAGRDTAVTLGATGTVRRPASTRPVERSDALAQFLAGP